MPMAASPEIEVAIPLTLPRLRLSTVLPSTSFAATEVTPRPTENSRQGCDNAPPGRSAVQEGRDQGHRQQGAGLHQAADNPEAPAHRVFPDPLAHRQLRQQRQRLPYRYQGSHHGGGCTQRAE